MPTPTARDRFFSFLKTALYEDIFAELVLGKYQGLDRRMRAISVRQIAHTPGKQVLSFISIYESHDTATSYPLHEALDELQKIVGPVFLDAHLVSTTETYHLSFNLKGNSSLKITPNGEMPSRPATASAEEESPPAPTVSTAIPWCRALDAAARRASIPEADPLPTPLINEFIAWLAPLIEYIGYPKKKKAITGRQNPFTVMQAGSGRGDLAFALASFFGPRAQVRGLDPRTSLVELCNRVAASENITNLAFIAGTVADTPTAGTDVLIALHARDTAADDAFAHGIAAGASIIVVGPCCHQELRPQLAAPTVWHEALKHDLLVARQAGPITDAFRILLLTWAGYKVKTFELTSVTQPTNNLLLTAIKPRVRNQDVSAENVRDFARAYGIRHQRLATHLGLTLD